ncbi:MAG: TonB-dependent receptor [Pseudobacteriovorax sp.]|nr:TonB-dependent receptor [Pseudobacteriovorax sp.]
MKFCHLKLISLTTVLIFLISYKSHAQDEGLSLEKLFNLKIEVSSSTPDTIFNTSSSVSVIDRDTIKRYGVLSISEAIETLAGVNVNRTFFAQNLPSIRGILQDNFVNRVLILIDGVPSWNSVTGHGELERINVHDLERIEVLKGPASVLYGTNAYAGAINLVLRKPEEAWEDDLIGEFRTTIGFDSKIRNTNGHLIYSTDKVFYYVSGNGQIQDGYEYNGKNTRDEQGFFTDEAGEVQYHKDFQNLSSLTGKVMYKTGYGVHQFVINSYRNEMSFLGASPILSSGTGNPYLVTGDLVNYQLKVPIGDSFVTAGMTYDANTRDFSRINDDTVRRLVEGVRNSAQAKLYWNATDYLSLDLSADYEKRTSQKFQIFNPKNLAIFNENNMTDRSVSENSIAVQLGFSGEKTSAEIPIRLLFGARQTNNESFDSNLSLRGTLVYNISPTSSLKFVYGESYRAPSLFELYYQDSRSVNEIYGNEELKPEKSASIEIAYLISPTNSVFLQFLAFSAVFEDKIIRVRQNPAIPDDLSLQFQNGNLFKATGFELEMKYFNPDIVNLSFNAAVIDGDAGDKLNDRWNYKFVPKETISIGLNRMIHHFVVSTQANYLGETDGAIEKIEAQSTVNAEISYIAESGKHTLQVKNLGDERVLVPEYIRGNLNSLQSGKGREFLYNFSTPF